MLSIAPHGDDGRALLVDNDGRADQAIHLAAIRFRNISPHQEVKDSISGVIAAAMAQNVADVFLRQTALGCPGLGMIG